MPTKNNLLYVAAPYTSTDPRIIEQRYERYLQFDNVMTGMGYMTVSPLAKHPILTKGKLVIPGDYNFWEAYSRELLSRSDALVVLLIDGWRESKGVRDEINYAHHLGKPIWYFSDETFQAIPSSENNFISLMPPLTLIAN